MAYIQGSWVDSDPQFGNHYAALEPYASTTEWFAVTCTNPDGTQFRSAPMPALAAHRLADNLEARDKADRKRNHRKGTLKGKPVSVVTNVRMERA